MIGRHRVSPFIERYAAANDSVTPALTIAYPGPNCAFAGKQVFVSAPKDPAAIDMMYFARYIRSLFRGEIADGSSNIGWPPRAAQRDLGHPAPHPFFGHAITEEFSLHDEAWGHSVDGNAFGSQLARQGIGQADHARFRCRVHISASPHGGNGTDINDAPAWAAQVR